MILQSQFQPTVKTECLWIKQHIWSVENDFQESYFRYAKIKRKYVIIPGGPYGSGTISLNKGLQTRQICLF